MRIVPEKRYGENKNTQFKCNKFSENPSVYKIIWKNMVLPDRPQMSINCCAERMGFAWPIPESRIQTHIQEY